MTIKPTKSIALGDISVNFVSAISRTMTALGASPSPILKKYGIHQQFLDTPEARVSIPRFMRMGHDAIQITNTPHFGLLMGQHTHVGDFGLPGFAAMTSENLGESLETLIRFEALSSQNSRGKSKFYRENDRAVCQFYSVSPYNEFNYFVVDSTLSSWFHFGSWLCEQEGWLHHIDIEHGMDLYKEQYEQIFGCPIYFGSGRNALVLKRTCNDIPNRFRNPASFRATEKLCLTQQQDLEKGKSVSDRVVDLISEHLSGSTPSIHSIAEKMGMAGWTLRRRLEQEHQSFKTILDETRHSLALSYVRDTPHNFSEVAFLLGFSSPSAFQRAFKRWTGMSPGDYRAYNLS